MNVLVRAARAEDAAAISKVIIAALRESNALDYPPEVIAQVAQNFAAPQVLALMSQRQVSVAIDDQVVVGTASLDQQVIRSVFVAPEQQGKGIGKLLMARIESVAATHGLKELRVPSSITAEGFYALLGFQKVRDEFHGAERTVIMLKHLTP